MVDIKKLYARAKAQGLDPIIHGGDHKPIMTRRDLLAQGFIAGSGMVVTPSIFGFVAHAQTAPVCGGDADGLDAFRKKPHLFNLGLAGGWSAGANYFVFGQGGVGDNLPAAGYGRLSVGSDNVNDAPDMTYGIPLRANSGFKHGLDSATLPETRALMSGFVLCGRSNDDNAGNQFNTAFMAYKAEFAGDVSTLIGSEATSNGARSQSPAFSLTSSVSSSVVNSTADALALVQAQVIAQYAAGRGAAITAAARAMSDAQLKKFTAKQLPDQVRTLIQCNYLKAEETATKDLTATMDFAKDDGLLAALRKTAETAAGGANAGANQLNGANLFTVNGNNNAAQFFTTGNDARILAKIKLLFEGYAGHASQEDGGYDYHNNARGSTNQRDFNAGRNVGLYFEAARYFLNKYQSDAGAYLILYSDGAAGCSDNTARQDTSVQALGQANPTNDQGESGMMAVFALHRKGRIPVIGKGQVNGMNSNGGVDATNDATKLIADAPDKMALAAFQNILAAEGIDRSKGGGDVLPESYIVFGKKPA